MANEIQADYERLQQIAQRFSRQAEQTQQVTQQVKRGMGRLQQSWEGRAADAFFREMNGVFLPGIIRLQKAFAESAQTVTRIAKVINEAETQAANLFKGANTGGGGAGGTGYGGGYGEAGGANNMMMLDFPSYNEQGDAPQASPELSAEQITALEELGINVSDMAGATSDQIQNAIDFLSSSDRISDKILDEGTYTGVELVEAAGILQRLEGIGVEFGQSKFSADTWSLAELRQAGNTFEQMAQGATREFLERYDIEDLTQLASFHGLSAENAQYAPLAVMMNLRPGQTFEVRRDASSNVSYIGTDAVLPDGSLATRMVYSNQQPDGSWSNWVPYNPMQESHTPSDTTKTKPVVWYARYDGNAITFGDYSFDGTDHSDFTDESLFAHEIAHRMAPETVANVFDQTTDDMYDNAGYENVPRSSNSTWEAAPDLLANGLLGTFTSGEAGAERASDFDDVVSYIFEANDPVPDEFPTPDDTYSQAVQTAMEAQGLWVPPTE
jgi:WXG100 family type VII secretion target